MSNQTIDLIEVDTKLRDQKARDSKATFLLFLAPGVKISASNFRKLQDFLRSLNRKVGALELRQSPRETPKEYDPISKDTPWASSVALVVRREVFLKVGGFDDHLPDSLKDIDLGWAIRAMGYRVQYLHSISVEVNSDAGNILGTPDGGSVKDYIGNLYLRCKYGKLRSVLKGHLIVVKGILTRKAKGLFWSYLGHFPAFISAHIYNCRHRRQYQASKFEPYFCNSPDYCEHRMGWSVDASKQKASEPDRAKDALDRQLEISTKDWHLSADARAKLVHQALAEGKKVAVTVYYAPDPTFRYRVYNLSRALEKSKEWRSFYFSYDQLKTVESLIPKLGLLCFVRLENAAELKDVVRLAQANHVPVIYDVDDRVCHAKYYKLIDETLTTQFEKDALRHLTRAYQKTAELSDGFIVTNEFLGQELKATFKKPYRIIPNSFNEEQLAASRKFISKKKPAKDFTIGYFSGSQTHERDFAIAAPGIAKFMSAHSEVKLRIVGMLKLNQSLAQFERAGRIEFLKYTDYLHLQGLISDVDVNIAPLVINAFTNSKSELKYFEASIVKTPTIASPTYTFAHSIQDGKTGLLSQPDDWYQCLEKLYQDSDYRKQVAEAAYDYCLKTYSPKAILPQIESAYNYYAQKEAK